ncbi:MAG: sporulation transcription factor Spo0A [Clostridia bacterium]|nr:sporulation transcription factor Spo0A [Clostridia bacterium]
MTYNKIKVVLTYENDEASVQLISALHSNKMEVLLCPKNGAELLSLIEESKPDVIIIDAFMRHIDALGVLSRINMTDPVKRPLIIILSNIDNANFQKTFFLNGADYYFLKPIEAQLVAERIVQLTSWKGLGISQQQKPPHEINVTITEALHRIGISPSIKGFCYVREAIRLIIENPQMLHSVTASLYPTVAKTYKCAPANVERAIRYAIKLAWDKGNADIIGSYFKYTTQGKKPTNSQFIATIADNIRLNRNVS